MVYCDFKAIIDATKHCTFTILDILVRMLSKKLKIVLLVLGFVVTNCVNSQSIVIDSLSPNSFSICEDDTLVISFSVSGFAGSNTYTAFLSKTNFQSDSIQVGNTTFTGSQSNVQINYVATAGLANPDSTYTLKITTANISSNLYPQNGFYIAPIPAATLSNLTQSICSGQTFDTIQTVSSNYQSGLTYTWSRNNLINVSGDTLGIGGFISNTLINNTTASQTVTYTIIPQSPLASSCTGSPITATIILRPAPRITNNDSVLVCSGTRINVSLTANTTSTFEWYADETPFATGEDTSLQNGATLKDTVTNSTSIPQTVTYHVTATSISTGCKSIEQIFYGIIKPLPNLLSDTIISICSNSTIELPLLSNIPSSFSWRANSNSNVGGEITAAQLSDTILNTVTNTTTSTQSLLYNVTMTSDSGSCAVIRQITADVFPRPTANFSVTNPTSPCERGNNFSFTAIQNPVITNYDWHFGTPLFPSSDNGPLLNISFQGTGDTIPVILTTSSSDGCVDSFKRTISIYPMPRAFSFVSDTTPCSGDTVIVTQIDTTNTSTLISIWGDGSTTSTCSGCTTLKHRYSSTSYPSLRINSFIAVTNKGCRDTSIANVNVKPIPFANWTSDITKTCFNNGIHVFNFDDKTSIADTTNNQFNTYWFWGDGTGIEAGDSSYSYSTPGIYIVDHVAISSFGCSDTVTKSLTVFSNPSPVIITDLLSDSVCSALLLTAYTDTGYTYLWSTGSSADSTNLTIPDSIGIFQYILSVEVTDSNRCKGITEKSLTVIPSPTHPTIIDPLLPICESTIALHLETTPQQNVSFFWHSEPAIDGLLQNVSPYTNINIPDVANDTLIIWVTATENLIGCAKTDTIVIPLSSSEAPQGSIVLDNLTLICTNSTATHYQWGYDDSTGSEFTMQGETMQDYFAGSPPDFTTSGKYYWVKVSNDSGCISKIYFNQSPFHVTSIGEINDISFTFFPNPANDFITVEASETGTFQLQLFNIEGENLLTQYIQQKSLLSLQQLAVGLYFVVLTDDLQNRWLGKLIKK